MSQVYADYRRGDENLTLARFSDDQFLGAARRHAEWLACASAIYWVRTFRRGYANYFVLEMEAELARQEAVRQALKQSPRDAARAVEAGKNARAKRFAQARVAKRGYLQNIGEIPHVRARERILRDADKWLLDPDVSQTVSKEISQILDGATPPPLPK
jgi:chorismate synthase